MAYTWSYGGSNKAGDTGALKAGTGGGSSEWWKKYQNSKNPWDAALQNAYGATAKESDGTGAYTKDWNSAVASAQGLVGKDYTGDLNRLAQEGITQEQTQFGNELGSMGMRELSFRKDVQDDWAKRRTDASTQASIDAQGMQTEALASLTSTIEGAGTYELEQIAADLARASEMVEAASAGSASAQDWEQMVADILGKYA